jgi:hypothetical protein
MAVVYPAEFRCAQITPYRVSVDMGLLRTPMESGLQRQRRLYRTMPTSFALEFVMTVPELGAWQTWVNLYAYDYFTMTRLETYLAGKLGEISSPHSVRFTSNLDIDNPVYGWVRVKVSAELDPLQPLPGPVTPTNLWVVAGTAPTPSTTHLIYAGTPAATAPDSIAAGTPAYPAAIL